MASESRPTEPVTKYAALLRPSVTTAARMDNSTRFCRRGAVMIRVALPSGRRALRASGVPAPDAGKIAPQEMPEDPQPLRVRAGSQRCDGLDGSQHLRPVPAGDVTA